MVEDGFNLRVERPDSGKRLDVFVSSRVPGCSRTRAAELIRTGEIRVQDKSRKPSYAVIEGETVSGAIPPPAPISLEPAPIPLQIVYEDASLIVIDKPPGLVVHPAPGHWAGTLVHALLHHDPAFADASEKLRPGIVHRLDKDTSGLLIVARTAEAHIHLANQFKQRNIEKKYIALVEGETKTDSGRITLSVGRHRSDRKRMSTESRKGRDAETLWRVERRFTGATLLEMELKTGRTHQLRVHCAAIGHPIIGDPVYGRRNGKGSPGRIAERQMLHAWKLAFMHPASGACLAFCSPLPADMERVLESLKPEGKEKIISPHRP
jgi:23S rRNA pseudouridine1911/1915/1917 synthase